MDSVCKSIRGLVFTAKDRQTATESPTLTIATLSGDAHTGTLRVASEAQMSGGNAYNGGGTGTFIL